MDVMMHYCSLAVFRFNMNINSMVVKELSLFPSRSIFMGSYINLDLNYANDKLWSKSNFGLKSMSFIIGIANDIC